MEAFYEFLYFITASALLAAMIDEQLPDGHTTVVEASKVVYELTYGLDGDMSTLSLV